MISESSPLEQSLLVLLDQLRNKLTNSNIVHWVTIFLRGPFWRVVNMFIRFCLLGHSHWKALKTRIIKRTHRRIPLSRNKHSFDNDVVRTFSLIYKKAAATFADAITYYYSIDCPQVRREITITCSCLWREDVPKLLQSCFPLTEKAEY